MAKDTSGVEIPVHLRPVLQAAAKNLLHHLYGPQGPAWGTSFASIEEMAVLLGNYLGTQLIQQSVQLQASQPLRPTGNSVPPVVGLSNHELPSHAAFTPTLAPPTGKNPPPIAITVARLFFPQSRSLGIDLGSFSPGLLKKIVYAGSNAPSFQRAAADLRALAKATVPVKQVERLTERIGQERQAERDQFAADWLERPLTQREDPPDEVTPPQLAVVEMDGGRLQIRADAVATKQSETNQQPDAESANVAPTGVAPVCADPSASAQPAERRGQSRHWREDKVGCLLTMIGQTSDVDPCPEIPSVFTDPLGALKLAQEIGHCAVPQGTPFQRTRADEERADNPPATRPGRPELQSRRVVASRKNIDGFGPLLAAAACVMGLFAAARRAFVADGQAENWSVHQRYFARWVGVLDFVHALTYVYAGAMAGRSFAVGWPVYERWIRWVWAGQVKRVIEEVTARQQELGAVTKEDKEGSPRRVVQDTLTYLTNQEDKMRYDEYRQQGLPLMSSHVESMVKQINYRVKGTEKFWTEKGAEALLQLRADFLSDDQPLDAFWQRRQAAASGQRRYRRAA